MQSVVANKLELARVHSPCYIYSGIPSDKQWRSLTLSRKESMLVWFPRGVHRGSLPAISSAFSPRLGRLG